MKRRSHLIHIALVLILLVSMFPGCIFGGGDDDSGDGGVGSYESYGEWPENEGRWKSITGAAGDKHSRWAYMDITIGQNGVFSGTYQSYQFDYVYNMETHVGTIPIKVYNPGGAAKSVSGAIDFENSTGKCTFQGYAESSFDVTFNSTDELVFYFDSDCLYTISIVER